MRVPGDKPMKKHVQRGKREPVHPPSNSNFSVQAGDLEARQQARVRTAESLKSQRTPLAVIEVAQHAVQIAADALALAETHEPRSKPAACVEGCAWCCYQQVGAAVPEVARIATYLRETLSASELHAFLQRLQQAPPRRSSTRTPCPLLVDNRCSVYPVRPLTCRGFNSSDARACEASVRANGQPVKTIYAPQVRLTTLVLDGVRAGVTQAGLRGDTVELIAALRIALEMPDAIERWLRGEPVFAPARLI
jgi:Fe-S-cluster containining protein